MYTPVDHFMNSPLGILLRTALISSLILPYIGRIASFGYRARNLTKLYRHLENLARSRSPIDDKEHKKLFLRLFRRHAIDTEAIEKMSSAEAGVFILGLQFYYSELDIRPEVDLFELISLADRAAHYSPYKLLLLSLSFNSMPLPVDDSYKFAERLMRSKAGEIKVRYKSEDADLKFFERLRSADKEEVLLFSTTSQVSNLSIDLLEQHALQIETLSVFLVSPHIETDNALLRLAEEYDLPSFAVPKGQFIDDRALDMLRRVLRILIGIDSLLALKRSTSMNIHLYLFRPSYPGIKVRMLVHRSYLQVLPGCLKYANNIYRFGVELTDRELIDEFLRPIRSLAQDRSAIEELELSESSVNRTRQRALREVFWYLVANRKSLEDLDSCRPLFRFILKSPIVDFYLDWICSLQMGVDNFVKSFGLDFMGSIMGREDEVISTSSGAERSLVSLRLEGNVEQHVSVGMLFYKDGQILVVKKKTTPYAGKLSIVAGHVEIGETPRQAIAREVREELGVTVAKFSLVKFYDNMAGDICRYGCHNHQWYVFICNEPLLEDIRVGGEEIEDWRWLKVEELSKADGFTFAARTILSDLELV